MKIIHPRPNPIVAALYTLRDLDIDVSIIHGPAGCGFMASRMLEEAGMRVVTTAMTESDLIFGASDNLAETIKIVEEKFSPKTIAVVGTCASMIIGEDISAAIRKSETNCKVLAVDCHGCLGDNISGAVKAYEAAYNSELISSNELERQKFLLTAAAEMEKRTGMAGKTYLSPSKGPTKYKVAKRIVDAFKEGKKVACIMIAKKELAYRFADVILAVNQAHKKFGGELLTIANLDSNKGLPRIRRYCNDILSELESNNSLPDVIIGGLDEYPVIGEEIKNTIVDYSPDLLIISGIPHAYDFSIDDILITDQPRQLANYLDIGCKYAVGEISSHSMVMSTKSIIHSETGDTIRELLDD